MIMVDRKVVVLLFTCSLLLTTGCGSSSSSSSSDSGGDDAATSENTLAVAYPDDLAVTSPLVGGASASAALVKYKAEGDAEPFRPQNFIDKREEMGNLLVAANPDDISVTIDFTKVAPTIGCYGPSLYLSGNHPDSPGPDGDSMLPPFDLGIWTEEEDGEACIAAQVNALMANIENLLNTGLKGAAAALGAANIGGTDLPTAGETDDITDTVAETFAEGSMPMTPETVTITRQAEDNAEGFPVYVTQMIADVDGGASGPSNFEATLTHIPEVDVDAASMEDSTYCGRMSQKVNYTEAGLGMPECAGGPQTECISISYCKDSATSMTYHVRRAKLCGQDADCFDANGDVDPTKNWQHDFFYIVAQVNPETGVGSFAQAWQAGKNDGNTRTFNVTVSADGTGCGYFGYGPDVSETSGVAEIDGMICNWAGPGSDPMGNKTLTTNAQQQCFTLNTTSGIYESDATNLAITYAPTKSCNKAAGTFAYGIQTPPTDVAVGTAVTNNLIDVTEVDFTLPALPVVSE